MPAGFNNTHGNSVTGEAPFLLSEMRWRFTLNQHQAAGRGGYKKPTGRLALRKIYTYLVASSCACANVAAVAFSAVAVKIEAVIS